MIKNFKKQVEVLTQQNFKERYMGLDNRNESGLESVVVRWEVCAVIKHLLLKYC